MQTEAQRRAALKYRKEHTRTFTLTLYPSDRDIINWLDAQPSKAKAVKDAIRASMHAGPSRGSGN